MSHKVQVVLRLGEHAEEELVARRLREAKQQSEGKKIYDNGHQLQPK